MTAESPHARSERLQKAYDAGDPGALIEALVSAILPPVPDATPHDRVSVERWALGAAFEFVCHVSGFPMPGVKLPKRGSLGRWSRRIVKEIQDLSIYYEVMRLRADGMSFEDALVESAPTPEQEDAVRAAYKRARRRLKLDPRRYETWDGLAPVILQFQPGRVE